MMVKVNQPETQTLTPPLNNIFEMAESFQRSAILKAAVELDVFTNISKGHDSIEKMASSIKASARGVRILLDALCSLGIISKAAGKYLLTPSADRFLVKDKGSYMGHALLTVVKDWEAFGRIAEAVKKGSPVVDLYDEESKAWEEVSIGLIPSGLATASIITDILGIGTKMQAGVNVLDLACGSGVYGYVLLQRDSKATVTDIDWQNVLKLARKVAGDMGVADRVTYRPGDILSIDYGEGEFDVAIASNILQAFDPETNKAILGKISKALKPGGTLVINDLVPDEERTKARVALKFAVYMLIVTKDGDAYTLSDFESWLTDTKFDNIVEHRISTGTTLITATKRPLS
ncbi:MAG: methyltransferase domain-containing protein [Deltaproteobacteria bacterium]|nr:methyltransferase domain-containing protein [Deltaproteobacteria bacterium]